MAVRRAFSFTTKPTLSSKSLRVLGVFFLEQVRMSPDPTEISFPPFLLRYIRREKGCEAFLFVFLGRGPKGFWNVCFEFVELLVILFLLPCFAVILSVV